MAEAVVSEEKKDEVVECVDFTGSWLLKKHETLDKFSTSQGINWAMRKLAGAASQTIDIKQTETHLEIKTKFFLGEFEQSLPFDGTTIEMKDPRGNDQKFSVQWKDEKKQSLMIKCENLTKKTKATVERFLVDKDTMKDVVVNDKDVQMIRIFHRNK